MLPTCSFQRDEQARCISVYLRSAFEVCAAVPDSESSRCMCSLLASGKLDQYLYMSQKEEQRSTRNTVCQPTELKSVQGGPTPATASLSATEFESWSWVLLLLFFSPYVNPCKCLTLHSYSHFLSCFFFPPRALGFIMQNQMCCKEKPYTNVQHWKWPVKCFILSVVTYARLALIADALIWLSLRAVCYLALSTHRGD